MVENIITSFDIDYLEADFEQLFKRMKNRIVVVKETLANLQQEEQKLNDWVAFLEKRLSKPAPVKIITIR